MVDYNLLNEMLEAALAKETPESWNERLDGGFSDSQLIDVVSTYRGDTGTGSSSPKPGTSANAEAKGYS